jgi:hypothetical protein
VKVTAQGETQAGPRRFRTRLFSWCKRHPEVAIGIAGGVIIAVLVPIFAEEATKRVLLRVASWFVRVWQGIMHDLDIGLH